MPVPQHYPAIRTTRRINRIDVVPLYPRGLPGTAPEPLEDLGASPWNPTRKTSVCELLHQFSSSLYAVEQFPHV